MTKENAMSIQKIELRDKVRIKDSKSKYNGCTGFVSSLVYNRKSQNIGVEISGGHVKPAPCYFDAKDLVPIHTV